MRRSLSSAIRSFSREAGAVSAIEFAIWAPLMCLMMFGGIDITRYAMATGRISDVARTIGQMLSVNSSGTVTYIDLQFYHDSAMVIYPQVLVDAQQQNKAWSSDMDITMTSVTFTPTPKGCTTSCSYVPKVLWSSGSNRRSCTVAMTSASDTSTSSVKTLPLDVFGATSVLVVDVVFTFRPIIAPNMLVNYFNLNLNVPISRSFYISPRYVSSVGYQTITGDPGDATTICP